MTLTVKPVRKSDQAPASTVWISLLILLASFGYALASTCSGEHVLEVTAKGIVLASSTSPADHLRPLDCSWRIKVRKGHVIRFNFTHFDTEAGVQFVNIYAPLSGPKGPELYAPLSGRNRTKRLLHTRSPEALVVFHVSDSIFHHNFSAVVTEALPDPGLCNGLQVLNATAGAIITDGSGEGDYPPLLDCSWRIVSRPGTIIRLHITYLWLAYWEEYRDSGCDTLAVYDGSTSDYGFIVAFCGPYPIASDNGDTFYSSGNYMFVTFASFYVAGGFYMVATELPSNAFCERQQNVTAAANTVIATQDSHDGTYKNDLECNWLITARPGTQIRITFSLLSLAYDEDSLRIFRFQGTDEIQVAQLRFSYDVPPVIQLPYTKLHAIFSSDSSVVNSGFVATVSEASPAQGLCSGTQSVNATKGGVIGPSRDPKLWYLAGTTCNWLITARPGYVIQLSISHASLMEGDTVALYEGASQSAPLLATLPTSVSTLTVLQTTSSVAFLSFVAQSTDFAIGSGFAFNVRDVRNVVCHGLQRINATAGGVVTDGSGPNAPYPLPIECSWALTARSGYAILLQFENFDIGLSSSMTFHDGGDSTAPVLDTLTTDTYQIPFYRKKYLVFITSRVFFEFSPPIIEGSAAGFAGTVKEIPISQCISGGTLTVSLSTTLQPIVITAGLGPRPSTPAQCSWHVAAPANHRISMYATLQEFSSSPFRDFIEVFEGDSEQGNMLASGTLPAGTLETLGNRAFVYLSRTDSQTAVSILLKAVPPVSVLTPTATLKRSPTLKRTPTRSVRRSPLPTLKHSPTRSLRRSQSTKLTPTRTIRRVPSASIKRTVTVKRTSTKSFVRTMSRPILRSPTRSIRRTPTRSFRRTATRSI
mmetsp:Transcript_2937/g.5279  ORF Transcript_2937/g.5279 Transcript_2937/m.5279 type:complete len:873 (+) Transcript_2937:198-2816(+)